MGTSHLQGKTPRGGLCVNFIGLVSVIAFALLKICQVPALLRCEGLAGDFIYKETMKSVNRNPLL